MFGLYETLVYIISARHARSVRMVHRILHRLVCIRNWGLVESVDVYFPVSLAYANINLVFVDVAGPDEGLLPGRTARTKAVLQMPDVAAVIVVTRDTRETTGAVMKLLFDTDICTRMTSTAHNVYPVAVLSVENKGVIKAPTP